jgi:hypothetical protein
MRDKILKVLGGGLLIVAPIVYLIMSFVSDGEEVTQVEGAGLPLVPLLLVIVIGYVGLLFVYTQFMNVLRNHPFSTVSMLFYGSLGVLLVLFSMGLLNNIITSVEFNYELFLADAYAYQTAVRNIFFMQLSGMGILLTNLVLNLPGLAKKA